MSASFTITYKSRRLDSAYGGGPMTRHSAGCVCRQCRVNVVYRTTVTAFGFAQTFDTARQPRFQRFHFQRCHCCCTTNDSNDSNAEATFVPPPHRQCCCCRVRRTRRNRRPRCPRRVRCIRMQRPSRVLPASRRWGRRGQWTLARLTCDMSSRLTPTKRSCGFAAHRCRGSIRRDRARR